MANRLKIDRDMIPTAVTALDGLADEFGLPDFESVVVPMIVAMRAAGIPLCAIGATLRSSGIQVCNRTLRRRTTAKSQKAGG